MSDTPDIVAALTKKVIVKRCVLCGKQWGRLRQTCLTCHGALFEAWVPAWDITTPGDRMDATDTVPVLGPLDYSNRPPRGGYF